MKLTFDANGAARMLPMPRDMKAWPEARAKRSMLAYHWRKLRRKSPVLARAARNRILSAEAEIVRRMNGLE